MRECIKYVLMVSKNWSSGMNEIIFTNIHSVHSEKQMKSHDHTSEQCKSCRIFVILMSKVVADFVSVVTPFNSETWLQNSDAICFLIWSDHNIQRKWWGRDVPKHFPRCGQRKRNHQFNYIIFSNYSTVKYPQKFANTSVAMSSNFNKNLVI